jgi:DNA-binding NarL/FixJ family response regulator
LAATAGSAFPGGARAPLLVGREREFALLHQQLDRALAGAGSIVLIGGEAGIGKTALAEAILRAASVQGAVTATGRCYDGAETPPYALWRELFARLPGAPSAPPLTLGRWDFFMRLRAVLLPLMTERPLVVLLDDLHWADLASIETLRFLARETATLPLLVLVTYRADETPQTHPLYTLVPLLVREARAERLTLRPLDGEAVHALTRARYPLSPADEDRLAVYVHERAEGNPLYLGELLRTLEDEGVLRIQGLGWTLGGLQNLAVPTFLQQVIEGRLARLGAEPRRLLTIGAVLGQEMPLALWATVAAVAVDELVAILDRARTARLAEEMPDGLRARFVHALIREALYEGLAPSRRRDVHQRAGEALLAQPQPDPAAVAHHLRLAGDPRAPLWLMYAGEQAQRAHAWRSAAGWYEAALAVTDSTLSGRERGWLLARLAQLRRYANPHAGLPLLAEAERLALLAGDQTLTAHTRFSRGLVRAFAGELRAGLDDLAAGTSALAALPAAERARIGPLENIGVALGTHGGQDTFVTWLALAGRYHEALTLGEPLRAASAGVDGADLWHGLGIAYAALGRPADARQAFARAREVYHQADYPFQAGWLAVHELVCVTLPYSADDPAARRPLAAEAALAWSRAGGLFTALPPRLAQLPALFLDGDWPEIQQLLSALPQFGWSAPRRLLAATVYAPLAQAQGNTDQAWTFVRDELPDGPDTAPGDSRFSDGAALQRVAATLALDAGDLLAARSWLTAQDRWLAWSDATLGRAETALGWARYQQAAGDLGAAERQARLALAYASAPRQPLALLAAQRILGQILLATGRQHAATAQFMAALALAETCAAPYEWALTASALAEARRRGDYPGARALLEQARPIFERLGVARAATWPTHEATPHRLTAREVEVLRLVAAGKTNREIGAVLALSERTVNIHVTHILTKTNSSNRAAAAAFALRHGLA